MASSVISALPPKVRTALGIADPFGKQINLYRAALAVLQREYGARISYHGLQPNWAEIEQVALAVRKEARVSVIGLWALKVRTLALRQIEGAEVRTKERKATTGSEVAAQMLKALGG